MNDIEALFKNKGNFSEDDVRQIINAVGYNDFDSDIDDDAEWNEDVMNDYADYIRNYYYTYKDIAQDIDSSIDPTEEHLGPMAQDIEKVNPACIKETEDGIKTVDTQRLAMMNAGVIADIIRRLEALEKRMEANNE